MLSKTSHVFLDRFEGGFGVLIADDGQSVDMPLPLLPDGIREGTAMILTLTADDEATSEGKNKVASLMDDLLRQGST
jgi:hypothetical protein